MRLVLFIALACAARAGARRRAPRVRAGRPPQACGDCTGGIAAPEWGFFLVGGGLKDTGGRDMPEAIRDKYQYHTLADLTRLRQAGWNAPLTSLEEGVAKTVAILGSADPCR